MDEMNQGTAHPTEWATKDEAQAMDSKGVGVSKPTERVSAYTKVQELYDWIYYAYVYRYSDSSALKNMMDDGVQELWSELADKVMKLAGDSMEDNLCSLEGRKL